MRNDKAQAQKGIIRNGQRKPFKKSTNAQVTRNVERLVHHMQQNPCALNGQLRRYCKREFDVEFRMAEHYIARAQSVLLERINAGRETMRAGSAAFYESVISDKSASVADRIRARERLDKLLGLDEKQSVQLEHTGMLLTADILEIDSLNLPLSFRKQLLEAVRSRDTHKALPPPPPNVIDLAGKA